MAVLAHEASNSAALNSVKCCFRDVLSAMIAMRVATAAALVAAVAVYQIRLPKASFLAMCTEHTQARTQIAIELYIG